MEKHDHQDVWLCNRTACKCKTERQPLFDSNEKTIFDYIDPEEIQLIPNEMSMKAE